MIGMSKPVTRSTVLAVVAFIAAATLTTSAAEAAPGWLAPVNLSPPAGQHAIEPQIALDAQGDAFALWALNGLQVSVRPASGSAWQTPVKLSADPIEQHIAVDPQGDAIAVWRGSDGVAVAVQAAVRPAASGIWQSPVDLSSVGKNAVDPHIALDSHGDAVAVWKMYSSQVIQTAFRPAGGVWQSPVDIGEGSEMQLAVDPQGDAIAVWSGAGGIEAAVRPVASGVWQTPVRISSTGQPAGLAQVTVDAQGNAVAVWQRFDGSHSIVQSTEGTAASGAWQPPVNLSAAGHDSNAAQIAVDPRGEAVAVWSGEGIESATRPTPGAGWQTLVDVGEGYEPQIALGADGGAIAVWSRWNGEYPVVESAVMPPATDSWQTPLQLSSDGPNAWAYFADVAVDPRGNAVAVWQRAEGGWYVVQGVGYDAAGPLLSGLAIPDSGIVGQPLSFSVSPLDVWSALTTTWSFGDGADADGTSVAHTYSTAGTYKVVLTSADALANATSASATVTIAPAPTRTLRTVAPTSMTPSVTDLTQSHSHWREGTRLASFARKNKAPLGTTFSFTLNEQARLRFAFTQQVSGRKVKGRCVVKTKKNRKRPACMRAVTEGTLSFTGHVGKNRVSFQGRISALRKLRPGSYTLLIVATNATGQRSQTRSLSFTIVK